MKLYTLLYLSSDDNHPNLKPGHDPVAVYLQCAVGLQKSLERHGLDLTILTNESARLTQLAETLGQQVKTASVPFDRNVPETLDFRSAHWKLDVFKAFGTGAYGDKVGLLDGDMLMLNALPQSLWQHPGLVGYDLWRLTAEGEGAERVRATKALLLPPGAPVQDRWWGGEFIFGAAPRFAELSRCVDAVYETYLEQAPKVFHQGDEMVVNAALDLLDAEGAFPTPVDGGALGYVGRWWSCRTKARFPRLSEMRDRSLIHLPSDKPLLARLAISSSSEATKRVMLWRALKRKTTPHRILEPLFPWLSKGRPIAPRI